MKTAVIVFPGSNCDHDAFYAFKEILHTEVSFIWHKESDIGDVDLVVLPGGFSYGDYLRSGAIARFSPVISDITAKAKKGLPVLGICNGFQVLTESHLLPGALLKNENLRFVCKHVHIRAEENISPLLKGIQPGELFEIPIAHGEGCYFIDDDGLKKLVDNKQIVFKYVNENGDPAPEANPNGSRDNIAGICNENGNVIGMMPHPERAVESIIKSSDGVKILESLVNFIM